MLTHTLPRCVPMHTPGPTHRPRFDGGFVFPHHDDVISSQDCLGSRSSTNRVLDAVADRHLSMGFHGGFTDLTTLLRSWHPSLQDHGQDQARRRRHWSSPREDGVQSEESSLNGRTVDSWQHCIPQPSAEAPQDCLGSASNGRARKSFSRCHRVVLSGHFAMVLSRQVRERRVLFAFVNSLN